MKSFKDIWHDMFSGPGRDPGSESHRDRPPAGMPRKPAIAEWLPGVPHKKGDVIGQRYEVHGILGVGGFGVVYLVYSPETSSVFALKTFRDEYLEDAAIRERFRREASVWVDLERHPYLLRAHFIDQISGRLYIGMEYIAPNEYGLNSLEGYLQHHPPDLVQSLRWAIQFCHGMEHAYSKGIRSHRDIKPVNILISQEGVVKITDFGLAGVLSAYRFKSGIELHILKDRVGLSGQTIEGAGFGTPTHMPPEQFTNAAACDERSDIYAFGIVLYQMVTGGKLPFLASWPADDSREESKRFWEEMYRLHRDSPIPSLNSPLSPIIQRCLEKDPAKRYSSIREMRPTLELALKRLTGEVIRLPELSELNSRECNNRGHSLFNLGRFEEAIRCYDQALDVDPMYVKAWNNKGNSLHRLGRFEDALQCFDRALLLDPKYGWAWNNKGNSLQRLGRLEEALDCHNTALELDHRNVSAWTNKGNCLRHLGRLEEVIPCYDQALAIDPREKMTWLNKGGTLHQLGRFERAIYCFDQALALDPGDAELWINRGLCLEGLDRLEQALQCYERALALDERNVSVWNSKGSCLARLGRFEEALRCFEKGVSLDPHNYTAWSNRASCLADLHRLDDSLHCYDQAVALDSQNKMAWYGKGNSLFRLHRFQEALRCFDHALAIDPRFAMAWINKALTEDVLGSRHSASRSYEQFLALAHPQDQSRIEYARGRLRELERR